MKERGGSFATMCADAVVPVSLSFGGLCCILVDWPALILTTLYIWIPRKAMGVLIVPYPRPLNFYHLFGTPGQEVGGKLGSVRVATLRESPAIITIHSERRLLG